MFPRRDPLPFWFLLLFGVVSALGCRYLLEQFDPGAVSPAPGSDVHYAFWTFIVSLAGLVFKGLQVAGKVALTALQWSVKALWAFAVAVQNVAVSVGKAVVTGFKKAWDFMRLTYDHVLKPAWQKFWKFVDWAHDTLKRVFGPILSFLDRIRKWVLDFYNEYVRPILDLIGFARRVLRILATLGIDWAKALDRKLADLEAKIQAPFTFVLGKLNEITNFINRIVTLDGLFQRLALIRSLERDVLYVTRIWHNSQSNPLTDEQRRTAVDGVAYKTGTQIIAESATYLRTGQGPRAGSVNEWATTLALRLGVS
jgi:hypothetical protein